MPRSLLSLRLPALIGALLLLVYFSCACIITTAWLEPMLHTGPSSFIQVAEEVADTVTGHMVAPFGHRILVPLLIDDLHRLTNRSLVFWLIWVQVLFLVMGLFAVRWLVRDAVPDWVAALAPLICLPLCLWLISEPRTSHQYAAFALTALSLAAIKRERWVAYGLLFAVGILVRETAVLLCLAVLVTQWNKLGKLRLVVATLSQILALALVKTALSIWHQTPAALMDVDAASQTAHTSALFQLSLMRNVDFLTGDWLTQHRFFALDWLLFYALLLLIAFNWTRLERFYRLIAVHAAALVCAMLVVGRVAESRIFLEAAPWLAACGAISATVAFQRLRGLVRRLLEKG